MANIKFSQFTVGNTESDIDFVVGYKGANNIQISPTNLLAASLSGYLPLTGGTMTGNIKYNSGVRAQFGSSGNAEILFNGSNLLMSTFTGDMLITNYADDKDIIFQSDDGAGGVTTYFKLDGGNVNVSVAKDFLFQDNVRAEFGNAGDLEIYHNGTNNLIDSINGDISIRQLANDKDIRFRCDDGSGGETEYFRLDGGLEKMVSSKNIMWLDNIKAQFGDSNDLRIYHNGTNNIVESVTGNLIIQNNLDDQDIIFKSDDGSGGVTTYFFLDGSRADGTYLYTEFPDNSVIGLGNDTDLQIYHSGTNSLIDNFVGDLIIQQKADDKDIIFKSDNGSGGIATYFFLDGSNSHTNFQLNARWVDSAEAQFGNSGDLRIYHDGTNSYINNATGNLNIIQNADDKDIGFYCDDGLGGITEYFKLDGNIANGTYVYTVFADNSRLTLGSGTDLRLWHSGTQSYIQNYTGQLNISANAPDEDIIFYADDGAGSITEYFRLDGSLATGSRVYTVFPDNSTAVFGSGFDFQIHHDASNTYLQQGGTGDLYFQQNVDDRDIIFQSDNGSGGVVTYFFLDGSQVALRMKRKTKWDDNIEATFGDGEDLVIKHNGTNNVIQSITGDLKVGVANTFAVQNDTFDENMITAAENGEVSLFHNNVKKLDTRTTGIRITGISEYADNTAAIAGGLTTGDVYRTGDLLKIVH